MKNSMVRSASKIVTLAVLALGAATVAACGSAPNDDPQAESTGGAEGALRCAPGTPCGGPPPACDPGTMCCWQGSQSMSFTACGKLLYNAGCRAPNGTSKAPAVQNDGFQHWWFEVYCPYWVGYVANDPVCVSAGIAFNFGGNSCTASSPGPNQVDVMYDPNCPSGCHLATD